MIQKLFAVLLCLFGLHAGTDALYLSWYGDPTTTMTIQWHAPASEALDLCELKDPSGETFIFKAQSAPFPGMGLTIYTLRLKNLEPDTLYEFQIGEERYSFQTAPQTLKKPLHFIIGGDLYLSSSLFRSMAKVAVAQDPLFAVLGGDIAYAIGTNFLRSTASRQWHRFLADWKDAMVTPDNRIIPFLLVAGNHDISEDHSDLFFALFAFPDHRLYRTVDFGSYLSFILLDTGHLSPIAGVQTQWLKKALADRGKTPYLLPVYHIGAYPSYYNPDGKTPKEIRAHWCPLFDAHHLPAVFEHHSHTFKITHPLRNEQIDPKGTIYYGDGSWGVPPRIPKAQWYLKESLPKNMIYHITLEPDQGTIEALGLGSESLRVSPLPPR